MIRHRGFTLLEVLITLVVLSIGLLGIAGLQILARKNSLDSLQRTSATYLADDLMQRMRSNPGQRANYLVSPTAPVGTRGASSTNPAPNCEGTGACGPGLLATYDLWSWEMLLDGQSEQANGMATGGLLNPSGCVTGPSDGSAGFYTVTIAWRGISPTGAATLALDTCGSTRGLYDDSASDNIYRRIVRVTSYLG